MNFNLSSILNGSLRFLNIANKAIPLIREMTPTIQTLKTKLGKQTVIRPVLPSLPGAIPQQKQETPMQNNSLTFFR